MNAWLQCIACAERFDIGPMFYGCPACKANGKTAPLEVAYALREISASSVWRFRDGPVAMSSAAAVHPRRIARQPGVKDARLCFRFVAIAKA